MRNTYRAMEVTSPGVFSLVERKIAVPSAGTGANPHRGLWCLPFGCSNCGSTVSQPFLSARSGSRGYRTNRGSGSWRDSVEGRTSVSELDFSEVKTEPARACPPW